VPPVTTPVAAPIVAEPVPADIVHEPVAGVQVSVVVCATHTDNGPAIAPGNGFTVSTPLTSEQPVGSV